MGVLINATTAAKDSESFYCDGLNTIGLVATGLTGADQMQVKVEVSDGVWHSLVSNGILTASAPELSIYARGTYMISKGITSGTAGAYST